MKVESAPPSFPLPYLTSTALCSDTGGLIPFFRFSLTSSLTEVRAGAEHGMSPSGVSVEATLVRPKGRSR